MAGALGRARRNEEEPIWNGLIRYRSPFGAVAAGTPVFFRVCLPRGWGCSGCRLRVCPDGKAEERYGMFWAGMEGEDREWWDCHYAPAESGLYFYGFELDIPGGTRHLSRRADGGALCGEQPGGAVAAHSLRGGV